MHSNDGSERENIERERETDSVVDAISDFLVLASTLCQTICFFFNMRIAFLLLHFVLFFSDFLFVAARFFALIMMMCVCLFCRERTSIFSLSLACKHILLLLFCLFNFFTDYHDAFFFSY